MTVVAIYSTETGSFTSSKENDCFENIFQAEQLAGQKLTRQTSLSEWRVVPR